MNKKRSDKPDLKKHYNDAYKSTEKDVKIKERIRLLMETLKLTKKDLEEMTCMHRTTIHRQCDIEGNRGVKPYFLVMLSLLTGVSKKWLEDGVDSEGVQSKSPVFESTPDIKLLVRADSVPNGSTVIKANGTIKYKFLKEITSRPNEAKPDRIAGFLVPNGEFDSAQVYTIHVNTHLQVLVNNKRDLLLLMKGW